MTPRSDNRNADAPRVSVVMSVFNGEQFLRESVESILNQSFTDFELIVINDGSTDETAQILDSCDDDRLRVVTQENCGLTKALNRGAAMARGEFVARQDADDISYVKRLEKQVDFFAEHSEAALVGTWIDYIDERGAVIGTLEYASCHAEILKQHPEENQFCHSAVMIRKNAFDKIGGYRKAFTYSQDYDLTLRLMECYQMANIPERLCGHRLSSAMISVKRLGEQRAFANLARQLWKERKGGDADELEKGASIEKILPPVESVDEHEYHRTMVYLYLRAGKLKLARTETMVLLKHNPFQPRVVIHFILTFFGKLTPRLLWFWGRLRYGRQRG